MLARARENLAQAGIDVSFHRLDFRELDRHFEPRFGAVVCLSNSINELLDDSDVLRALRPMRAVLRPGGLVVVGQGQNDASMRRPPVYEPIVNDPDLTRLFVMGHDGDLMTVHILDFLHSETATDLEETVVRLRIRLRADWRRLMDEAGFPIVDFFGEWSGATYNDDTAELATCLVVRAPEVDLVHRSSSLPPRDRRIVQALADDGRAPECACSATHRERPAYPPSCIPGASTGRARNPCRS
jgi:SAM-dependent methyltransferase